MKSREANGGVVLREGDDEVYLRAAVTFALFLPSPIIKVVAALANATRVYLDSIPKDALRWQCIGASTDEWSPIAKTAVNRSMAQLDPKAAAKREISAFELADDSRARGYGITVVGNIEDTERPERRTLFEVGYPHELLVAEGGAGIAERVRKIASLVQYESGYVAQSLRWAIMAQTQATLKARGLAARHPGYDFSNNTTARLRIGSRVRGARWLTFLGPILIEKLGGKSKIVRALGSGIAVFDVGVGIMIQAGSEPELGDVNKKVDLPLLRKVASVLEPITYFKENALMRCEFFDGIDNPFVDKWERRFLD